VAEDDIVNEKKAFHFQIQFGRTIIIIIIMQELARCQDCKTTGPANCQVVVIYTDSEAAIKAINNYK
jgi:hypothetical protein